MSSPQPPQTSSASISRLPRRQAASPVRGSGSNAPPPPAAASHIATFATTTPPRYHATLPHPRVINILGTPSKLQERPPSGHSRPTSAATRPPPPPPLLQQHTFITSVDIHHQQQQQQQHSGRPASAAAANVLKVSPSSRPTSSSPLSGSSGSPLRPVSSHAPRAVLTSAGWKERACSPKSRLPTPRTRNRANTRRVIQEIISPAAGPHFPPLPPDPPLPESLQRRFETYLHPPAARHSTVPPAPFASSAASAHDGTRDGQVPAETPHGSAALPAERVLAPVRPGVLPGYTTPKPTRTHLVADLRRQQRQDLQRLVGNRSRLQHDFVGSPLLFLGATDAQ